MVKMCCAAKNGQKKAMPSPFADGVASGLDRAI